MAALARCRALYPNRRGETYSVKYNPNHRWFYFPEMTADEALLLCYDSAVDGRTRFGPHTAFIDQTTPADAPPRESIEGQTFWYSCPATSRLREEITTIILLIDEDVRLVQWLLNY